MYICTTFIKPCITCSHNTCNNGNALGCYQCDNYNKYVKLFNCSDRSTVNTTYKVNVFITYKP